MDDHQNPGNEPPAAAAAEPVRSRWTPKPEQILILESIFNSGMVNPPKDETVRIRKLLENFGSVGDANVFYWFQNRRSRSRRRQRQIQASLASGSAVAGGGPMAVYDQAAAASCSSNCTSSSSSGFSGGGAGFGYASSSSGFGEGYKADDLFSVSSQMRGFGEDSYGAAQFMSSYEAAQMPYQTGSITVFINGVQTEVPRGAIDIRAMFGDDLMLVHSSGEPLPLNEHGILLHSLQMGESYYLVARPT